MSKYKSSCVRFIVLGFIIISISALSVAAENSWSGNIFGSIWELFGLGESSSTAQVRTEKGTGGDPDANSPQVLSNGPILFQRGVAAANDVPYNRGGQLFKVDPTSGAETLFGEGSQPNYTIDGSNLVFVRNAHITKSSAGLYSATELVNDAPFPSSVTGLYPKWSPDATRIAYNSTASVNSTLVYHVKIISGSCSACDITQELNPGGSSAYLYPAWHPTVGTSGTSKTYQLVFVRTSAIKADVDAGNYTGDIFTEAVTIAPNGTVTEGSRLNLTNSPATYGFPTYSHDGTKIAFVRRNPDGSSSLNVMNAAPGSIPTAIVSYPANSFSIVHHPAWSPNDQEIAFADTNQLFRVTPGSAAVDLWPSWAPGSGNPTPTPSPTPFNATLSFDGRLRDRVNKHHGSAGLGSDGDPDGTFTLNLPSGTAGKTLKSIDLCQKSSPCSPLPADNNVNRWNTIPADTSLWVLGVDYLPEGPSLINSSNDGSIDGTRVSVQGAFKLYVGDPDPTAFALGSQFSVTVNFTDGTKATASTIIGKTQADVSVIFSPRPQGAASVGDTVAF